MKGAQPLHLLSISVIALVMLYEQILRCIRVAESQGFGGFWMESDL